MKKLLLTCAIIFSYFVAAQEKEHEFKELHDESCLACHIVDHDKGFYTREETKMKTYNNLHAQVGRCVGAFNLEWFPEDQDGVVDYLNKSYYHFKKPIANE